jgi:23S rRNA (guanine745-N1)-methyltransferase
MLREVVEHLCCPVCRGPMARAAAGVACGAGHNFDAARQGYVNLISGQPAGTGDTAAMVAARAAFLSAGFYSPLADEVARTAAQHAASAGLLVELGAGTAYYLASTLDRMPGRFGLAVDVSKHAARRAAKAHARLMAAVCDVRAAPLPLADASAAAVLAVFAPRPAAAIARVLRPDGVLIVATPTPEHLGEIRGPLRMLDVDPDKEQRLTEALAPQFLPLADAVALTWALRLDRDGAQRLVAMGPSAWHVDPAALAAGLSALPETVAVTASVTVRPWRRR